MEVKIKKLHEKAVVPVYSTEGAAGMDLTAVDITTEIGEDGVPMLVYHTGISMEIPEGHVGLIFPRSSIAKTSLVLTNSVGVIDSDYRGEIMLKFKLNTNTSGAVYRPEDRVAQMIIVPYPKVTFEVTEELTKTERGEGGYGSTDTDVVGDAKEEVTDEVSN